MLYALRSAQDDNGRAFGHCLVETRRPKGTPKTAKRWEEGGHSYRYVDAVEARDWVKLGRLHETALYVNHERRVVRACCDPF